MEVSSTVQEVKGVMSAEMVSVPREATAEMVQAMEDRQIEGASYLNENSIQFALWKEVWKAAIVAWESQS
jgi:hypothetical protein